MHALEIRVIPLATTPDPFEPLRGWIVDIVIAYGLKAVTSIIATGAMAWPAYLMSLCFSNNDKFGSAKISDMRFTKSVVTLPNGGNR